MGEKAFLRAVVRGRVQGVFFRRFIQDEALALDVSGWVENLSDGASVEVQAEGERAHLEALLGRLRQGPPGAWVREVEMEWGPFRDRFRGFVARR